MRHRTYKTIVATLGGFLTLLTGLGAIVFLIYPPTGNGFLYGPPLAALFLLLALTLGLFVTFIIYQARALALTMANQHQQRFILDAIINNAASGIYVKDTNGRYMLANQQIANNLGVVLHDLPGKTLFDVLPVDKATRIHQHDEQVLHTGATLETEEELFFQGTGKTYISTKFPIKDADGKIMGVCGIDTDITGRKEDERKLEEAFNRINDLYNNAPCGYYSLNAEGTLVEINDTLLRWLGYKRTELVGKCSFITFLTPHSQQLFHENFSRFLSTGNLLHLELEIIRADGSTFWAAISATAEYDKHGRFMYSRSNLHDITSRKKAEREIQLLNKEITAKLQSLQEANNELTTFTHSVSHDLRAPLRAIHSFISLIDQEYKAELSGECLTMFESVQKNAERMSNLIDDLLAYSRVGRSGIQPAEMDIGDYARVVMTELLATEKQRHITFECGFTGKVICDKVLMRQVLVNLLGNAVKYSANNPQPVVTFGKKESGEQVVFYVKDNGAGFDMRYANKLFQMFQRLHTSREFEGTGVGLAIVQRIVQKHGGKVWAEGKVNEGATFYFSLPNKSMKHELN